MLKTSNVYDVEKFNKNRKCAKTANKISPSISVRSVAYMMTMELIKVSFIVINVDLVKLVAKKTHIIARLVNVAMLKTKNFMFAKRQDLKKTVLFA